jgi:2-oxoacid:acceptor oxidoreductase delta subunit (pyruvate/2-ketoisovalerate family)
MKVPEWVDKRPISPWLAATWDRRYIGQINYLFGKPYINLENCNICSLCWSYCPEGAISRKDGVLKIDYEDCRGCGICVEECPKHAISFLEGE